jgi:hypothetical protein
MTLLRAWFFPHFLKPSFWRLMAFPGRWEKRPGFAAWVTLGVLVAIPLVGAVPLGLGLLAGFVLDPVAATVFSGAICTLLGLLIGQVVRKEPDLATASVLKTVYFSALAPFPFLVGHYLLSSLFAVCGALVGLGVVAGLWTRLSGHVWEIRKIHLKKGGQWILWQQAEEQRRLSKTLAPAVMATSAKKRL